MAVHGRMPVVTTIESWMQRLGVLNLAGIVDNVFRFVRKLSSDALQGERNKVRSLLFGEIHLGTGDGW